MTNERMEIAQIVMSDSAKRRARYCTIGVPQRRIVVTGSFIPKTMLIPS